MWMVGMCIWIGRLGRGYLYLEISHIFGYLFPSIEANLEISRIFDHLFPDIRMIVGRKIEKKRIERLLMADRSAFLAITGRRRVGKTFLIDTLLGPHFCFSMTGIQNGNQTAQLVNFGVKLAEYSGNDRPQQFSDWQTAFLHLKSYLKTLDRTKKHVIFLDELPWIATPKSGFVQFLAHFWNDFLSKEPHFILVICGSATSWISQKIINDPGGLHNRVTEHIHLFPFTIAESREFLLSRGLLFSQQDIAKTYMLLGGIPFYLEKIQRGESVSSAIERLCFAPNGILHNEYSNLFQALFNNPDMHRQIVAALASKQYGMSHEAILSAIGMTQPTGSYNRAIEELIVSDFIVENSPFGKKKRGATFRLVDEFSHFYHRFLSQQKKYTPGIWQQWSESQTFKSWSGYAFETLCLKHIETIKKALGIAAVYTEVGSFLLPSTQDEPGVQIDLILDRKDNCINLCEIKFYSGPYTIDKEEYQRLIAARQCFIDFTKTKKQVFWTFITNHGLVRNTYAAELVDTELVLEDLLV
jgi:uncharacterized protein